MPELDPRRRFTATERAALFLAADGRCTRCDVELEPGWHADHEDPWSNGGATDVINGQALCEPCNLKKGASVNAPRKWQADALREFMLSDPNQSFLVEATPGAGKTRLAIDIAKRLIEASRIDQIVVAVPTSSLERQWAGEFAKQGISVDPKWHAADGALAKDETGCVATYAEIARQPQIYRRLVSRKPTLVILDEIHHCGDERMWGDGARTAFEPATRRLLLSGTPFRSDNNAIPFVRYVDGTGTPDVRYGYGEALRDRVVRSVFFPRRGGSMEWDWKGQTVTATFDDLMRDRDASQRLRTALSPYGQWIPSVLADADRQLMELRESDPTAGAIVFCETSEDARVIADLLRKIGRDPVLAITEEPEADTRIGTFRDSREPWIVSIRKVSEGVDIPRLRVGVYATPWLTEMFFRQVVGRLVRTNAAEEDPTSYLFIPDDERLRAMALAIRDQRDHVLEEQVEEQLDLFSFLPGESIGGAPGSTFRPISAIAMDKGVIVDTETMLPDELERAEKIKLLAADTAGLATALVAKLLRNAGALTPTAPAPQPSAAGSVTRDRKDALRQDNRKTVARIKNAWGVDYSHVQIILNQLVGMAAKGGMNGATEDQLKQRLAYARQWRESGVQPKGGDQ